ncbi:MAG: hypothetical protein ABSA46_20315 [Thermodesulfovibrionales bacterium]
MDMKDGIAFIILLVSIILWIASKRRKETQMKVRQLEKQMFVLLRRGVTLVASDMIPGYEIIEVVGSITGDSEVDGSKRFGVRVDELEELTLIMYIALSQGADAVTCFKMSTGNHRPDSKRTVSKVVCLWQR